MKIHDPRTVRITPAGERANRWRVDSLRTGNGMRSLRVILAVLVIMSTALLAPTAAGAASARMDSGIWEVDTDDQNIYCYDDGNSPDLGACKNRNVWVANFGYLCGGCDYVRLYWGTWYTGAYYCLPRSTVIDSVSNAGLKFNRGSGGGYGKTIWRNVASVKWSGPC
ncbi:hypothetical protein [Sphaerisporangium aureirubrum]|uniref:Uncharacterized protein n=1 Tax=Sphaerisporangium aureirubrum TaxID=1544736 RepID=A0ABW1NNF7_9ACTN